MSLHNHLAREVIERQTRAGDFLPTCPLTDELIEERIDGCMAHIVPHGVWNGVGGGCGFAEFHQNPDNIIYMHKRVDRHFEAWNHLPTFSLKPLLGAQAPPGFPNDVVYEVVYSRRCLPTDPCRQMVKNARIHLHKRTIAFVAIHYKLFCSTEDPVFQDVTVGTIIKDFCVNSLLMQHFTRKCSPGVGASFRPDANASHTSACGPRQAKPSRHSVASSRDMISKTFNLNSNLFKHSRGEKPPFYTAQVIGYNAGRNEIEVVYFDGFTDEQLTNFFAAWRGHVKKSDQVVVRSYNAADFNQACIGESDHPGYPMNAKYSHFSKGDCCSGNLTTSSSGGALPTVTEATSRQLSTHSLMVAGPLTDNDDNNDFDVSHMVGAELGLAGSPVQDSHCLASSVRLCPEALVTETISACVSKERQPSLPSSSHNIGKGTHAGERQLAQSRSHIPQHACSSGTPASSSITSRPLTFAQARPRRDPRPFARFVAGPAPSPHVAHAIAKGYNQLPKSPRAENGAKNKISCNRTLKRSRPSPDDTFEVHAERSSAFLQRQTSEPATMLRKDDRVQVYWTDEATWFTGTVTRSAWETSQDGTDQRITRIAYDAVPGRWSVKAHWHCLEAEIWCRC